MPRLRYEWDPEKARSNERKHGVSFEEAVTVLLDPLARTYPDADRPPTERREITLGWSSRARLLFVAHATRSGRVRLISARRATARERRQHEEDSF